MFQAVGTFLTMKFNIKGFMPLAPGLTFDPQRELSVPRHCCQCQCHSTAVSARGRIVSIVSGSRLTIDTMFFLFVMNEIALVNLNPEYRLR